MSTPQPTDTILVSRGGTNYHTTIDKMSTLQDTDLLLVNRGGADYKCAAADVKAVVSPPIPGGGFSYNANTDTYTRVAVADRYIGPHVRMRRCVTDGATGSVLYYLDADDSTKKAGDWLRLTETTELSVPFTGTHGAEVPNKALRATASNWSPGTYSKGAVVIHNGKVWECLAATTASEPAAGTVASGLITAAQPVMVEIPRFSVRHDMQVDGSYHLHNFHISQEVDGHTHPAFVRVDGTLRDHIYLGAYLGNNASGQGSSVSGATPTVSITRATARTTCLRGQGTTSKWSQYGYWHRNALQWLFMTEYQDVNSRRVLGDAVGGINSATGYSNSTGNRSHKSATGIGYRGFESFYLGSSHTYWLDGCNLFENVLYISSYPAKFADGSAASYEAAIKGAFYTGAATPVVRDFAPGPSLAPAATSATASNTFAGDGYLSTDNSATAWLAARQGQGAIGTVPTAASSNALTGFRLALNP